MKFYRGKSSTALFLIIFSIFFIFTFNSCKHKEKSVIINNKTITIGTFNMDWLGDGIDDTEPRSEDDYKNIAEVIKQTGIEVLGIEEIENDKAIKRVLKYLPEFDYVIGKGGNKQNVGLLYKDYIDVKNLGEYFPLEVERGGTRPGLLAKIKKGNFEALLMVVHLKSTSHYDDTQDKKEKSFEIREKQAEILQNWFDSYINSGKEKNIIITGDFNDSPLKKTNNTLLPLFNDKSIYFLTDSLENCKFQNSYVIDQIIVSEQLIKRFIRNSGQVFSINSIYNKEKTGKISDHCPVSVIFDIQN